MRRSGVALVMCALPLVTHGCRERGELHDARPDFIFGARGIGPGQFTYPRAITLASDGCVFIVDKTGRIQRFSPEGKYETAFLMPKTDAGYPTGITVDNDNRVIVADTHYSQIIVFDRDGNELTRFGENGTGPGQFMWPSRVAVAANGDIYVSEYGGNDRISRFTADLEYISSFGGSDAGEASLSRPQAIVFDAEGDLWVADAVHHRICRFSPEGEFLSTFGTPGREPGQLNYPYDLEVCPDGTLMVAEFGNNRVQHFDRRGNSLGVWGGQGHGPGELMIPWGVAVSPEGVVYVLDSGNNRVQMFRM